MLAITYQAGHLVRLVLVAPLTDLFEQLERSPSTRLDGILTGISRTLQVATGAAPALATGNKKVTNVACSAGMVAVKFGKGILCVTGPGDTEVSVIRGLLLKSVGCQTRLFGFSLLSFGEYHQTFSPLKLFHKTFYTHSNVCSLLH